MNESPITNHQSRREAPIRIALIAGEASGDLLGADLATGLRRLLPSVELVGVAGPAMRSAGVEAWVDCEELAVMGLAEVLRHLPRLLRLRRRLRQRLLDWKPDLVVGIDAPDFNLGLERWLKQRGVATAHYVSPSVWAWREGRVEKIGASCDRVLCLFPMEPDIYARHAIDARFVGHPLASRFAMAPDRAAARRALGLAPDSRWLAVLPGSRRGEIGRLSRPFLEAAALFRRQAPELGVLVPMTGPRTRDAFEQALRETLSSAPREERPDRPSQAELWSLQRSLRIVEGRSQGVLEAAELVLLASGTAALEAMLAKQPMVVGYRIAALTHALVMGLGMMRTTHYSLPNILAGRELVAERMQGDCTPSRLAEALLALHSDPTRRAALDPEFRRLHEALRAPEPDAAARALLDPLPTGTCATSP
ncbi:lipid-A-disaccharide synthase [Pseudomarimonas salicorniae]|uniref:Lipid-A-disaccharide synthase n=1 Tax=Pseudomarimonas salicorniae TaxID=2933270 RepID=A0ABT0GDM5_9GAMM|nr:lipid-A-disaccharide synthase [Lysobacter sp. CAU 1642]MCK7592628.1 lipid-A-disaccharide synthase [Lysobacter sp. CAU 1642]